MYANHYASTAYPRLRASLSPEYAELSDEQLDALVAEIYGDNVTAADVEGFWNDLGRGFKKVARGVGKFAQQAAPVVAKALPSIATGALTGATVAGPWGALAGAVAGGAGGIMAQSKNKTVRSIGGTIGGVGKLASSLTGRGALTNLAGVALGGGSAALINATGGGRATRAAPRRLTRVRRPAVRTRAIGAAPGIVQASTGAAANALLGLLSRPETLRALQSAALGGFGRQQVPVGNQAVPVQAILGALGSLSERVAAESEPVGEQAHPEYFYADDGELAIDPADSAQRAEALLELFAATPSPHAPGFVRASLPLEYDDAPEHDEPHYTDADAAYDEWLQANEDVWAEQEMLAEHGDE